MASSSGARNSKTLIWRLFPSSCCPLLRVMPAYLPCVQERFSPNQSILQHCSSWSANFASRADLFHSVQGRFVHFVFRLRMKHDLNGADEAIAFETPFDLRTWQTLLD